MRHGIIRTVTGIAIPILLLVGCSPANPPSGPVEIASTAPSSSALSTAPSSQAASPAASSPSASAATSDTWWSAGTLPKGWTVQDGSIVHSDNAYIEFLTDRSVMSADCGLGPQPGVGRTASAIADALAARDGLATTNRGAITIGSLSGQQIDIVISPDWKGTCPWWGNPTSPVVPLIGTFDENNLWNYNAVVKGEQYRYVVLDLPNGGNMLIAVTAIEPEHLKDIAKAAMQVVRDLEFAVPS